MGIADYVRRVVGSTRPRADSARYGASGYRSLGYERSIIQEIKEGKSDYLVDRLNKLIMQGRTGRQIAINVTVDSISYLTEKPVIDSGLKEKISKIIISINIASERKIKEQKLLRDEYITYHEIYDGLLERSSGMRFCLEYLKILAERLGNQLEDFFIDLSDRPEEAIRILNCLANSNDNDLLPRIIKLLADSYAKKGKYTGLGKILEYILKYLLDVKHLLFKDKLMKTVVILEGAWQARFLYALVERGDQNAEKILRRKDAEFWKNAFTSSSTSEYDRDCWAKYVNYDAGKALAEDAILLLNGCLPAAIIFGIWKDDLDGLFKFLDRSDPLFWKRSYHFLFRFKDKVDFAQSKYLSEAFLRYVRAKLSRDPQKTIDIGNNDYFNFYLSGEEQYELLTLTGVPGRFFLDSVVKHMPKIINFRFNEFRRLENIIELFCAINQRADFSIELRMDILKRACDQLVDFGRTSPDSYKNLRQKIIMNIPELADLLPENPNNGRSGPAGSGGSRPRGFGSDNRYEQDKTGRGKTHEPGEGARSRLDNFTLVEIKLRIISLLNKSVLTFNDARYIFVVDKSRIINPVEIKEIYKEMVLHLHPDMLGYENDPNKLKRRTKMFQVFQQAYNILNEKARVAA